MISYNDKLDIYEDAKNLIIYLKIISEDISDKHSKKYKTSFKIINTLEKVLKHYDIIVLENLILLDTLVENNLISEEEKEIIYAKSKDQENPTLTISEAIEMAKYLSERFPKRAIEHMKEIEFKNKNND